MTNVVCFDVILEIIFGIEKKSIQFFKENYIFDFEQLSASNIFQKLLQANRYCHGKEDVLGSSDLNSLNTNTICITYSYHLLINGN